MMSMDNSTKPVAEYYEAFHRERNKKGTVHLPEKTKYISDHIGIGKYVLDLSCRYGDLTANFVKGNRVVGTDVDRNALQICEKEIGIPVFFQDLNTPLQFKSEEFDAVVLSEVLEHLPYPDFTLKEIHRVLKPGGIFLGSVPNGTRLRNRIRFLLSGVVEHDPTHLHYYSGGSLRKRLSSFFNSIDLLFLDSKYLWLSENMFANYIVFSAQKPK